MKILFLDDDEERHKRFNAWVQGQNAWVQGQNRTLVVTSVRTAQEAIDALARERFDEVSLDHDLGGPAAEMDLPDTGSGYDVARFLADELPIEWLPKVVVLHSFNQSGRMRMAAALAKREDDGLRIIIQPFAY